jgi:hypothetical protein
MAQGSLGEITVPTPGTPVGVTTGTVYAPNPAGGYTKSAAIHAILIQVLPGNTGKIYVGGPGFNKSTGVGRYCILPIPTVNFLPAFNVALTIAPNALTLNDYYIDADNADDGVTVSFLVL